MDNQNHCPFLTEAFVARAATGLDPATAAKRYGFKARDLKAWETGLAPIPVESLAALRNGAAAPPQAGRRDFRFVDLFAGIGGMRRAFDSAGGECVFTAEWNAMSLRTYLANHGGGHPVAGDITKVPADAVPDHDVLVAGFPCQAFSLAGVSKKNSLGRPHGFLDKTQGTLFFDVARIIEAKRPPFFLLENVKNLLAHDKGRTFEVIRKTLADELGYSVSSRVMDGAAWVPQKRKRIAIVGFRDGPSFDFDEVGVPAARRLMKDVLHAPGEPGSEDCPYAPGGIPLEKYTLSDGMWAYLRSYADKHASKGNGFGFGIVGPGDVARTLSARYGKDGSEILVRQEGRNPRRLTPRECARLMGFDMPGQAPVIIPVSDAQAYKQFGNSVVVPCFTAVARAIAPHVRAALASGIDSLAA